MQDSDQQEPEEVEEVGLEIWINEHATDLNNFAGWWQQGSRTNPGGFPMKMYPGDWDEAFLTYQEYGDDPRLTE